MSPEFSQYILFYLIVMPYVVSLINYLPLLVNLLSPSVREPFVSNFGWLLFWSFNNNNIIIIIITIIIIINIDNKIWEIANVVNLTYCQNTRINFD